MVSAALPIQLDHVRQQPRRCGRLEPPDQNAHRRPEQQRVAGTIPHVFEQTKMCTVGQPGIRPMRCHASAPAAAESRAGTLWPTVSTGIGCRGFERHKGSGGVVRLSRAEQEGDILTRAVLGPVN